MTRYLNVLNFKVKEKTKTELLGWKKAANQLHLDVWTWQIIAGDLILYLCDLRRVIRFEDNKAVLSS